MRAVLQRVQQASVRVQGRLIGEIRHGLLVFLGVARDDTEQDMNYLVEKITGVRVFEDQQGKMNVSVRDAGGSLLVVSQFTLYGDCRKGRRPSFSAAATSENARYWYTRFIDTLRAQDLDVHTGSFQEMMAVELINDGPVTLLLDSRRLL